MKVPKTIFKLIKDIEVTSNKLSVLERKLYIWLQNKNIDTELDIPNEDGLCIDLCLEFLFHNCDGSDLIKYLNSYEKEKNK